MITFQVILLDLCHPFLCSPCQKKFPLVLFTGKTYLRFKIYYQIQSQNDRPSSSLSLDLDLDLDQAKVHLDLDLDLTNLDQAKVRLGLQGKCQFNIDTFSIILFLLMIYLVLYLFTRLRYFLKVIFSSVSLCHFFFLQG